ncbi:hypothetical protein BKA57DRAFT_452280 [Linnemannia elongata]|nr:hypothetical protein BKA57DRAFT_452280 [Linnemannia elongata]
MHRPLLFSLSFSFLYFSNFLELWPAFYVPTFLLSTVTNSREVDIQVWWRCYFYLHLAHLSGLGMRPLAFLISSPSSNSLFFHTLIAALPSRHSHHCLSHRRRSHY